MSLDRGERPSRVSTLRARSLHQYPRPRPNRSERRRWTRTWDASLRVSIAYRQDQGRLRRRSAVCLTYAEVLDLSVGGALLRAAPAVRLASDDWLLVAVRGGWASASVRHVVPVPDSSPWRFYGTHFTASDQRFRTVIAERLATTACAPQVVALDAAGVDGFPSPSGPTEPTVVAPAGASLAAVTPDWRVAPPGWSPWPD